MIMKTLPLYHKPRKKRATPEASLQKAVVQYLRVAGVPGVLFFSVPNEAKRSPRLANHLKAMGMLPGVSDLVICVPESCVIFLELKAKGEKPSRAQDDFAKCATASGHYWTWADNIEDAITILQNGGAIKPVSRRSLLSRAA